MKDKVLDKAEKECPFFTGVEYCGMYECGRDNTYCTGCDLISDNWFIHTKAHILLEIEMWYQCWFLYQVRRCEAYLFNKRDYYLFYIPYFWDKENRRRYIEKFEKEIRNGIHSTHK